MAFHNTPSSFHRRRRAVYQIWSTVDAPTGLDKALHRVVDRVLVFLSKAMAVPLPPEAGKYQSFEVTSEVSSCECIADQERTLWSLRYKYTDAEKILWFYNIAMIEEDGELLFGLKIETPSNLELADAQRKIPLVDDLLVKCALMQVRPVIKNSWTIDDPAEIEDLYNFLVSPHRSLPVILFSEINRILWKYTPQAPSFLVNMEYLAPKVIGYAYVVRLSFRASYAWKNRVGNSWAAFDGACRTYYPNIDFRDGNPFHHPCAFKDKIWHWSAGEKRGPHAYSDFLVGMVRKVASTSHLVRKGLYFVPDARILVAELDLTRAVQEANAPEREKAQKRQIEALKFKLNSAEEENEDWLGELDRMQELVDYYKQENTTLRAQIDALRSHLSRQTGGESYEEVEEEALPTSLDEIPDWTKKHLAGQLVLLPRAERALSKSDYSEPEMAVRALLILAREYRNSRLGLGNDESWKNAFAQYGMELSGSIDRNRAEQYGDEYFVNYPPGSDSKQFLRFHIERGNSRESRYCLRVYFFWDDDTQQVVVGWLPGHLRNRMT